jgi:hypothetical protein
MLMHAPGGRWLLLRLPAPPHCCCPQAQLDVYIDGALVEEQVGRRAELVSQQPADAGLPDRLGRRPPVSLAASAPAG